MKQPMAGVRSIQKPPRPVRPALPDEPSTDSPAPHMTFPAWVPLALAVALIVVQQVTVALHALPPSTPITVTLIILTTLSAIIVGVQALIAQWSNSQERLIRLRARLQQ